MKVTSRFMYLWLKTVKGVNLKEHCAKAIIGEYSTQISNKINEIRNIPLQNETYYLCGVSLPYVWANNFHLAFKPCKGKTISINRNGIEIEIKDAEEIHFSIDDIEADEPLRLKDCYRTCRCSSFR